MSEIKSTNGRFLDSDQVAQTLNELADKALQTQADNPDKNSLLEQAYDAEQSGNLSKAKELRDRVHRM